MSSFEVFKKLQYDVIIKRIGFDVRLPWFRSKFHHKITVVLGKLEKEMATHSSILAWRIPWTVEPGGLQSMGSQRVGHD